MKKSVLYITLLLASFVVFSQQQADSVQKLPADTAGAPGFVEKWPVGWSLNNPYSIVAEKLSETNGEKKVAEESLPSSRFGVISLKKDKNPDRLYFWESGKTQANFKTPKMEETFLVPVGENVSENPTPNFAERDYLYGLTLTVPENDSLSNGQSEDTDQDGVPDDIDQCPTTPKGVGVDDSGCPVDTDGDSVPDYQDECPSEPGLIPLDGCPDKDEDGVADYQDDCPDVFGLAEFKGCPDSDNDGVPDAQDQCADTPELWPVDESGCPLDTDGDGLYDPEDDCPDEVGTEANNGCPE